MSSFKTALANFRRGLTSPSMTSTVLALAIPLVLVATAILIGDRLIRGGHYEYLMSDPFDVYAKVGHEVMEFQASDRPGAVLLGDSLMVYCVDEDLLPDIVKETSGVAEIEAHLLATPNQSTYEMAAIVDAADLSPGSVVLVGLSLGVVSKQTGSEPESILVKILKNPRLPFQSAVLDEEARLAGVKPPFRTGIYAFDNAGFYIARKTVFVKHLLAGPAPYGDPLTAPWLSHVDTPEFHAQERAALSDLVEAYSANADKNFDVLARMIERERDSRGVDFVIAQAPINPGWYDLAEGAAFFQKFAADAEAFAQRVGARYVSVSAGQNWSREDFFDYEGHLKSPAARSVCTETVASAAARELRTPS